MDFFKRKAPLGETIGTVTNWFVEKVGPELYIKIGFHHPPPPTTPSLNECLVNFVTQNN